MTITIVDELERERRKIITKWRRRIAMTDLPTKERRELEKLLVDHYRECERVITVLMGS